MDVCPVRVMLWQMQELKVSLGFYGKRNYRGSEG